MRLQMILVVLGIMGGLLAASAQTAPGGMDLGTIEKAVPGISRRIQIESSSPTLQKLLQGAFSLHGAFEVRTAGSVHFVFNFEPTSANIVELKISSGGQTLLTQSFTGDNQTDAALKAADLAVRRTVDLPGFFSGTIAFISEKTGHPEVYVSDFLFTDTRRLTHDNAQCMSPNLAPDGRSLLYTSYHRSGFPDIYKIDLVSHERTIFASFRGLNTGATYSPSGNEVAMILSGSGNSELYVSDASGNQMRRLTRTTGLEADPTWSPDGQRLAFTSDDLGKPQIFVINADGGNMRRVPTNISGNCSEPIWNPRNPDQIAFTAAVAGEFEVCLFNFSEGVSRIITRGAGDAVAPTWLADGRHLVYTERTARTSRLTLLDTITGKKSHLTSPAQLGHCSMADYVAAGL